MRYQQLLARSSGTRREQQLPGGGSADSLPLRLPPKHLYTCTVGRSMASRAAYSLNGSMEVAVLLHRMALADGITTSQLQLPGLSTSASFDDLLHQLMMAEGSLSASMQQ